MVHPLPKGEGRGEGKETNARLHNRMDAARPHSLRAHLSTAILRSNHHCPPAELGIWCLRFVCCLVFFINTWLLSHAGSGRPGKPASTRPVLFRPRLSVRAGAQRASAFSPRPGLTCNAPAEATGTLQEISVPLA